jgi:thiamine-phosphate diphosphorylase
VELPLLWAIHDDRLTRESLGKWCERLAAAGVDGAQVRHRARRDDELWSACREARRSFPGSLSVNGRAEVACAARFQGVHLPENGVPIPVARYWLNAGQWVGRSAHDAAAAVKARTEGADYVFFGPLFPTRSKPGAPGHGIPALAEVVAAAAGLAVYALGGVRPQHFEELAATGARGIAAIEMFERAQTEDLSEIQRRAQAAFGVLRDPAGPGEAPA